MPFVVVVNLYQIWLKKVIGEGRFMSTNFKMTFLKDSGNLLLWVGVRLVRRAVCVVRRPLRSSSQELLGQSLPNLV